LTHSACIATPGQNDHCQDICRSIPVPDPSISSDFLQTKLNAK